MVQLLIEGWRGISHSYALLSQRQTLEMAAMGGVSLYHRDLPFAFAHWKAEKEGSGFSEHQRQMLESIRAPEATDPVDAIYRVCSPFRAATGHDRADRPTMSFMITELGLAPADFCSGEDGSSGFVSGRNRIVTSSAWSRDRIVDYGFPADRVDVVPLGVDAAVFKPVDAERRRALRHMLGLADDDIVFLNIGAPLWTKGTDLLLRAFSVLRRRGRKVRLIVKDQTGVYGLSLHQMIEQLRVSDPGLSHPDIVSSMTTVPQSLSLEQLSALMNVADCYVSPYRAEGFNLPVLEAIACGVPVITTAGGATDTFCCDALSVRIGGTFRRQDMTDRKAQAFIEPDFDALVEAMAAVEPRAPAALDPREQERMELCETFSWTSSARRTIALIEAQTKL